VIAYHPEGKLMPRNKVNHEICLLADALPWSIYIPAEMLIELNAIVDTMAIDLTSQIQPQLSMASLTLMASSFLEKGFWMN
jgi:hypothetical protein